MADETVDTPVEETVETPVAPTEGSIVDRLLHRTDSPSTPGVVEAGECLNCGLNGKTTKLNDGLCPACGFVAPRG